MTGTRINAPWLTAAQLGEIYGMTERAVRERVTKKQFICHWTGGTLENPRGMRFTAEDIEHNSSIFMASQPAPTGGLSKAKIQKGVARLRRAQQAVSP
jgi:hypothetical protein